MADGEAIGGKQESVRWRERQFPPAAALAPNHSTFAALPGGPLLSGTMPGMAVLLAAVALVSGVQGLVTKGPIAPVCRQGEPCTAPVRATLLFHRAGRTFRTRSGPDGRYRILLAPGYYMVTTLERIGIDRNIRPRTIHVRSGHVDRLDFAIDTGIR